MAGGISSCSNCSKRELSMNRFIAIFPFGQMPPEFHPPLTASPPSVVDSIVTFDSEPQSRPGESAELETREFVESRIIVTALR
jgi:hypothetical protein